MTSIGLLSNFDKHNDGKFNIEEAFTWAASRSDDLKEVSMAQVAIDPATRVPKNFRTVIMAAACGNVIEWYDFYIFGSLATILSVKFFEKSHLVAERFLCRT